MAKTKKQTEKPEKKKVKKWRMSIGAQHKDFSDQDEARKALIKVLESEHVYFASLEGVEVDED